MRQIGRSRRHKRFTKKLKGTTDRPRLAVFRSKKHIYAQIIVDDSHKTMLTYSTLHKDFKEIGIKTSDKTAAKEVGQALAKKSIEMGIKFVSFDRGGYKYHGRVKDLAEGARKGGLQF